MVEQKDQRLWRGWKWTVGAVAVFVALAFLVGRSREPSYKGVPLSQWLRSDYDDHGECRDALRAMGTNALPLLVDWLGRTAPKWQSSLYEFLEEHTSINWESLNPNRLPVLADSWFRIMGPDASPAIPAIIRLGESSDKEIRQRAIGALVKIAWGDSNAISFLRGKLRDPDPEVSELSISVFTAISRDDSSTFSELVKCLDDPRESVVESAIFSLGERPSNAKVAVPILLSSLTNTSWRGRQWVPYALQHIEGDESLPHLIQLLDDPDEKIRIATVAEIGNIRNASAVSCLQTQLITTNKAVLIATLKALIDYGSSAQSAVPELRRIYRIATDRPKESPVYEACRGRIAKALVAIDPEAAKEEGITEVEFGNFSRKQMGE